MQSMNPSQLALGLHPDPQEAERLVQEKVRELFEHSRFLRRKYGRLESLMQDPIAQRCLRLCATQLLRLGK